MDKAWLSSWQGVESLPVDAVKMLLSALARLPFSASIDPPPLPAISKAVTVLLSQLTETESSLDGNDDTLEGVELVERVVARLLKFTWNLKRDDVKDALDEMIAQADSSLSIRVAAHRTIRSRLGTLLNEMEKSWIIKVKVREWTEVESTEDALPDWRHPTVAWLADYRNFQPTLLPKLQQARTSEGRVYESTEEYFVTIVKLWIGMTFVEGNNALLPHCTVKMGDKVCDQPLWPFPGKEKLLNCKNSQCDRYATFLCAHRLHAKGYCSKCAAEYQQRLRGPPSKYASTHIYDGVISSVKYDGTISLEQIESRRPPLNPIHWRTTKRLSSPNLVGIVRLANREASLRATDEYLDEPGNKLMAQNPSVGRCGGNCRLPDVRPRVHPGLDRSGEATPTASAVPERLELIRKVIQFSLLDPIIDIRRDAALRNRLEHSLLGLVNSATLDPGQLKSFAEAMMYPVHCTQGPPGTGSRTWVWLLFRALLIVRDLWKQKNREVGDPPILVLSYKNHAD
ncbi:hypothetical protein PF003_g7469 [Phytophthora fragariae]|nr:hypothetical protein PF003_g7469 [Phytophthora fragariae]